MSKGEEETHLSSKIADDQERSYDVAIIGGGASGSALLYVLSRYTSARRILLLEKYGLIGSVNTNARNNSQTLHVGDIETNYSADKVKKVYPAAMMVKRYTDSLPAEERKRIIKNVQKMVLGVGKEEVSVLDNRFENLKEMFPMLQKLDEEGIRAHEPEVMRGRKPGPIKALLNSDGYAVNFGNLARSLVKRSEESYPERVKVSLSTEVVSIERSGERYSLKTSRGEFSARTVVVDADAYSLGFAKELGYGRHFSLIPIAGNFYLTPTKLRGKVYRVQNPRMPFAAIHGDPELTLEDKTRWGPTARFYPVLEAGKLSTMKQFFSVSGFEKLSTWNSFAHILLDPVRFWYLFRNFIYDLPFVGKYALLSQLRKIVPTIKASELERAKGYGGMRLQRVDTNTKELLLGEGKIIGDGIIFNMTPSPGASVCLYNAMRDACQIEKFVPEFVFDRERMLHELCISQEPMTLEDVSQHQSYAS